MENPIKYTYHIDGMSCGGCAADVQQKLSAIDGISSVTVDLGNKQADITSSKEIKIDSLRKTLSNTNYTISEL